MTITTINAILKVYLKFVALLPRDHRKILGLHFPQENCFSTITENFPVAANNRQKYQNRQIIQKNEVKKMTIPNCKKCNAPMILKSKNGGKFWACSNWHHIKSKTKCSGSTVSYYSKKKTVKSTIKVERKKFPPTIEQTNIYTRIQTTNNHLVVKARAGTGKTTTLMGVIDFLPTDIQAGLIVFNTQNAEDNAEITPAWVYNSTTHSLALKNVRATLGKEIQIQKYKIQNLIRERIKDFDDKGKAKEVKKNIFKMKHVINLLKGKLLYPTEENIDMVCSKYNVDFDSPYLETIYGGINEIFYTSIEMLDKDGNLIQRDVDFSDVILFCATGMHGVSCRKFDVLMLDEVQDFTLAQIHFAMNSLTENGRIIAVGDEYQSIYGFRGADTNAIPLLIEKLQADIMPLTVCFRCSKAVVAAVNREFNHIKFQTFSGAKEGSERYINETNLLSHIKDGDLAICRMNAPLMKPCFSLLKKGIKAYVLGKQIGVGLINTIQQAIGNTSIQEIKKFWQVLDDHHMKRRDIIIAKNDNDTDRKLENLEDNILAISAIAEEVETVNELISQIDEMFSDDSYGIRFSSIHKAKGKEAENIFILRPELMPSTKAISKEDIQQEQNIIYVAMTRSKDNMFWVNKDNGLH